MIEPRIVVALANSVWQSAILVVFTMALLRIMSRTSANLRYAVWLATLAVCLLLPVVDYMFVRHISEPAAAASRSLSVPNTVTDPTTLTRYVITPGATHYAVNARAHVHSVAGAGASATRVYTLSPTPKRSALELPGWLKPKAWGAFFARLTTKASRPLFWLWIVIADVLLARISLQLISLMHAKRRVEIIDTFDWISQRPGVKRRYSVGISDTIDIPCLLGLTQPLIAIPRAIANELSSNDLRRIVVHESAHVRRYDDWFNLLEQCVLALLFFNPALYFATRALHLEREIACDDQVVAADERLFYAECLSMLAGRTRIGSTSFVPSFFSGRRELLIRIEQLLDRKHIAHARLGLIPYAVAAILGVFALVLGQTGIPVLAAQGQAPAAAPTQQPAPHNASPVPHAKPAPKALRPHPVIQTTQTITVRVSKPKISPAAPRVRVRQGVDSSTQTVTESETVVVDGTSACAVAPMVKPVAAVSSSEAVMPVIAAPVVMMTQVTAATRVNPAQSCPPSPAIPPGAMHHVVRIDSNTKVIVICTKPLSHIRQHVRMTDADITALKAAGCTVTKPVEIQKVLMDSMRGVDIDAINAEVDRARAEVQKSLQSMPRDHTFREFDAATRAFAQAQASMSVAEAKKQAAEIRQEMAQMRRGWALWQPMKIDASKLKIDMPEIRMLDDMSLPQLPVKEITDMCNHGVTGAYIRSLSRVGYAGLPAADYIRLHDHGITADDIQRISSAHPGEKLSVDDLIRLQH